jgi:hypothetical protein
MDRAVSERVILTWILEKQELTIGTCLDWLRIEWNSGLLWTKKRTHGFHKRWYISLLYWGQGMSPLDDGNEDTRSLIIFPTVVTPSTPSSSQKCWSQRRLSRDCHYQRSREETSCTAGEERRKVHWRSKCNSSNMWRRSFEVTYFCCVSVSEGLLVLLGRQGIIKSSQFLYLWEN